MFEFKLRAGMVDVMAWAECASWAVRIEMRATQLESRSWRPWEWNPNRRHHALKNLLKFMISLAIKLFQTLTPTRGSNYWTDLLCPIFDEDNSARLIFSLLNLLINTNWLSLLDAFFIFWFTLLFDLCWYMPGYSSRVFLEAKTLSGSNSNLCA